MTRFCLAFVLVGFFNMSLGQVSNNNIGNRLPLVVDNIPLHSTTANSSVEWNCISKVLTNKCLVYHNDQWFEFKVQKPGTYFLNISAQQCREKKGLQAIVIEGNPCAVKTYRILHCISKIPQDDVFIRLDSVKPGITYLMNIDGFLGDYCDFNIRLSTQPDGLPVFRNTSDSIPRAKGSQQTWKLKLEWKVDKSRIDEYENFRVLRRNSKDVKSIIINEQPVRRNAYGAPILNYELTDSLDREGIYTYQVYAIQRETLVPFLILVREVRYFKPVSKPAMQRILILALNYADKTPIEILVYNRMNNSKLISIRREFDNSQDKEFEIDLGDFLDKGATQFMILVSEGNSREALEFYYRIDAKGKLIRE